MSSRSVYPTNRLNGRGSSGPVPHAIKKQNAYINLTKMKELDIIVSYDTKTMLSGLSIKAYKKVNFENGLKNPDFIQYQEYKRRLDLIDSPM